MSRTINQNIINMKKLLLTLATFVVTTGAWAESYDQHFLPASEDSPDLSYFEDVSQKNFRFFDTNLTTDNIAETLFPSGLAASAAANLGAGWINANIDYTSNPEYRDGIIVLGGAYAHNNATNQSNIKSGLSVFDFGGHIGKALILNGNGSTLSNYLYENFKENFNLTSEPVIPKATSNIAQITQFFWVLDKELAEKELSWDGATPTVRVRIELNYFNPAVTDKNIFAGIYRMNGENQLKGSSDSSPISSSLFRQYKNDFSYDDVEFEEELISGSWNPYRWVVFEFDYNRETGEMAYSNLKMQMPANALDNAALLIRNIEVYYCGHSVANQHAGNEISEPYRIRYNDYWRMYPEDRPVLPKEVEGNVSDWNDKSFSVTFDETLTPGNGEINVVAKENNSLTLPTVTSSISGRVLTVNLKDGDAGTYSVTIPQGFVTVGTKDYNAEVTKDITIDREVSDPTAGPTSLAEGYGFTYTFDGDLSDGIGSLNVTSESGKNNINVTHSLASNVLTVKVTDEEPVADTYTVIIPEGFVNIGKNGKNGLLNGTITVVAKPTPEAKKGETKVEGNVLTVTFEAEVKEHPDSQEVIDVFPPVENLTPDVKTDGNVLTVTLAGYPANTYAVTIPEGYLLVGDIDYNAKVAEKVTIAEQVIPEPDPVEPEETVTVLPDLPEGTLGFALNYKENLTKVKEDSEIKVEQKAEGLSTRAEVNLPTAKAEVEGKTLTVTLAGGDPGTYTVTIPEGFVKIGENGKNAVIVQEITVEEEEIVTPTPSYPTVNPGTDITPANYKFKDGGILPIHPTGFTTPINISNNGEIWKTVEGDQYWNDGLMVVSSAGGLNAESMKSFVNSWNYIDFGGEVGRVACYINNASTAVDDLKILNSEENWDAVNVNEQVFGGGALNFFLDPDNCPKTGYIHAKFVFNIHDANLDSTPLIQYFGVRDNQNNTNSLWNGSVFTEDAPTSDNKAVNKDACATDAKWDPTKWITYEFDFSMDGTTGVQLREIPARIKMMYQPSQANNTAAIFFKEISFTHVEDGEPTMMGERYQKVETLQIGTPKIDYIPVQYVKGTAKVDNNVLTVTFNESIKQIEGKSIAVEPEVKDKTPKVEFGDKTITVTLEEYPDGSYSVTIPEGFVIVGKKSQNLEVIETLVIENDKVATKEDFFKKAEAIPSNFIDVTPIYYKFHEGNTVLEEMLRDDIKSPAQTNFGNDNYITKNTDGGENWFTTENLAKGNLIYRAGGYHSDVTPSPLKKGISLFDFGGEIGEVLVFNGRNSNLNEAIQKKFGLTNAYNIPKLESNFNNMQLMWILSRDVMNAKVPQGGKVHVRMEVNVYNNDMTVENDAFTSPLSTNNPYFMTLQDQEANAKQAKLETSTYIDEFTYRRGDSAAAGEEYDGTSTGEWNPYRWIVLDFEADYNRMASYLRTFFDVSLGNTSEGNVYNNGAWLIRSIEVYGLPNGYTSTLTPNDVVYKSWNEYTTAQVEEPSFKDYAETPSEKSIAEEDKAGDVIEDANFSGFHNVAEVENLWTGENTTVSKNYYYSTAGKNSTLADDAVKVDASSISIAAPADMMGEEFHYGVVKINTDIPIQKGATYNFSCTPTLAEATRAANVPNVFVKLSSDGGGSEKGLANKTTGGSVHYISNASFTEGNLVVEVHFGDADNAGKEITLANLTFALNKEADEDDDPKEDDPGKTDPSDPDDDFGSEDYEAEQTVNRALQLTEDGTVNCGAMPDLNNLSSYSIQFWMKPATWTEGAVLMHRGDNFAVELGADNTVVFRNGDNTVTATGFTPGEWNQVTMIVNNGQASVLVNSQEGGNGTLGNLEETKRAFIMGGGYKGYLDEVRLWNAALNDMMKRFDYFTNNTLNKWNPMWENLVAYYKMDQEVAPILVDYKVIETPRAGGSNNHGVFSDEGVERVPVNNDKMPYLVNAAYTENERFYDRLIPKDAYLLSNEIIVLGADCVAEDGSVRTRLANNHASIYGGVEYVASQGNRTGVAYLDGKEGSYIQAPAESAHKYRETSASEVLNEGHTTFTYMTRLFIDEWQPGACIFSKENADKSAGLAIFLGETPKTFTVRANGKTNTTKEIDNFNLGAWNHITIVPYPTSRSAATKFNFYVGAQSVSFDTGLSSIEATDMAGSADSPIRIGEGLKGYIDEAYFTNNNLNLGMIQTYANRVIVPTVEQGRNVKDMNAAGFLYNFDKEDNLGYSTYSQDYIADYIRSLYKGYTPAKVTLSVRGHSDNTAEDAFRIIMNDPAKTQKFAQDLVNAAAAYDGVEFDLEWCEGATQWSNYSKLSDAVEELLPEDKTFRISIHNAYYDFPKDKIGHEKITGFTVQQYGPNKTFYPYSTFTERLKMLEDYGYPKDKLMTSFATTMEGGGDIRGGAFANYELNDNDVDTYDGKAFMGPMQIFKRARYTRENNYQGIFYWAMGNDYWLGSKDMGSGGVANYEGMPEYNGAKYSSYGLNANIDKVVISAKINHPETEVVPGEEIVIPDLDDDFENGNQQPGDNDDNGDDNGDDNNGGDSGEDNPGDKPSYVDSLDNIEYVDVYTTTGILVKKSVNASDIQNSLNKGIYIVNGQKVIVK